MAIVLGTVDDNFNIVPPQGGFGGIDGCRLSNYTGDALIITNIDTERPGQQYLMPFQQMVYKIENLRQAPSLDALTLGQDFSTSDVLVEWSTEALHDFPGIYPCTLVQAALAGSAAPAWENHQLAVPADGTTVSIVADARRISMSFMNDGTEKLMWSYADNGWGGSGGGGRPSLDVGSGRQLDTKAQVFFRIFNDTGSTDGHLQWFETRYGSVPID